MLKVGQFRRHLHVRVEVADGIAESSGFTFSGLAERRNRLDCRQRYNLWLLGLVLLGLSKGIVQADVVQ